MKTFSSILAVFCLVTAVACGNSASTTGSGAATATDTTAAADLSAGDDAATDAATADIAGTDAATADTGPFGSAGTDTTVGAYDKTPIYFTGADNQRTVDKPASFPATGSYEQILLHLSLSCPKDGCDPYDRLGSLGIVTEKSADGQSDKVIELVRFITPFHVGASWDIDVTDLRPLLVGDVTMRAFIDTWVGPGSQYGGGWLLTAQFEFKGGVPAHKPIAVLPVWTPRGAVFGDPAKPLADSVPTQTVALPAGATSYALRAIVTGHGQGNASNCAEFCPKNHTLTAGGTPHALKLWRADCATSGAPNQQGTYKYARAGWCPGADVLPWTVDVTADLAGQKSAEIGWDVEGWTNTCRPDAQPCTGCTLGTGCGYDGGAHTEPYYQVSALLIAFE